MNKLIGILGGRTINCSQEALALAESVGMEIARRGFALVCGGEDGIMEAACKGCKAAGGVTLGVLKWNHAINANPYIDYAIPTSMDLARNNIIIWMASGLIAFEGRYGTASEIALTLDVGRPIVITGKNCIIKPDAMQTECSIIIETNDPSMAGFILDQLCELITKTNLFKDARHK